MPLDMNLIAPQVLASGPKVSSKYHSAAPSIAPRDTKTVSNQADAFLVKSLERVFKDPSRSNEGSDSESNHKDTNRVALLKGSKKRSQVSLEHEWPARKKHTVA